MDPIRIVVANEPCAYREVIAAAMRELRPQLEVLDVEPHELDGVVARLAPAVVICSRLGEVVETRTPVWVLLYPDGEDRATISVAGRRTHHAGMAFGQLLAAIDQSAQVASAVPLAP